MDGIHRFLSVCHPFNEVRPQVTFSNPPYTALAQTPVIDTGLMAMRR